MLERPLQFDVQVCDLPRMTRLSLAVYEVARQARGVLSVEQSNGKVRGCRHRTGEKLENSLNRGLIRAVPFRLLPY